MQRYGRDDDDKDHAKGQEHSAEMTHQRLQLSFAVVTARLRRVEHPDEIDQILPALARRLGAPDRERLVRWVTQRYGIGVARRAGLITRGGPALSLAS